ncbi:MAG: hypothetical protein L3J14_06730 [Flavobacteriaceae bacterium]|nr:hypothetical protein [Flavobacteriaceae bacterium]
MKKLAILFVFIFVAASLTSCKSQKGCGLTGDINTPKSTPVENVTTAETVVVA